MKTRLITSIAAGLAVVLFPVAAFAQTASPTPTPMTTTQTTTQSTQTWTPGGGTDLKHAYTPVPVNNNQWIRARVNNVTHTAQNKLVCVEAWGANNTKNHLGCLTIPWEQTNNWQQEFDAPLYKLGSGSYKVQYTYQKENGQWYNIDNMEGVSVTPSTTR